MDGIISYIFSNTDGDWAQCVKLKLGLSSLNVDALRSGTTLTLTPGNQQALCLLKGKVLADLEQRHDRFADTQQKLITYLPKHQFCCCFFFKCSVRLERGSGSPPSVRWCRPQRVIDSSCDWGSRAGHLLHQRSIIGAEPHPILNGQGNVPNPRCISQIVSVHVCVRVS